MIRRFVAGAILSAFVLLPSAGNAATKRQVASPARPSLSVEREPLEGGNGAGVFPALGEVWRVPMERKEIALTFDDGPYPFYTPLLLYELERSHAPGTFFLVGRSAQEFPDLVRRIVSDGDEIGNHTFNHYKLTKLNAAEVASQIDEGGTFLEPFAGQPVRLFRPPYGRYDHRVVALAHAMGYETVFWNDSPEDTKNIPPSLLVARALAQATPGGIVLLHNGQYKTIEALPVIIDRLRARGYRFVTVTQLLEDGGIEF